MDNSWTCTRPLSGQAPHSSPSAFHGCQVGAWTVRVALGLFWASEAISYTHRDDPSTSCNAGNSPAAESSFPLPRERHSHLQVRGGGKGQPCTWKLCSQFPRLSFQTSSVPTLQEAFPTKQSVSLGRLPGCSRVPWAWISEDTWPIPGWVGNTRAFVIPEVQKVEGC